MVVRSLAWEGFCVLWLLPSLRLTPRESQQQQHGHHHQQKQLQGSNYGLDTLQGNYIHPAPARIQSLASAFLTLA